MGKATCYMCNAVKTSREHVPPQCLFPEQGTFGRDLRRNLLTVPSCDAHNSAKSKDDEFLRTVLSVFIGNNAAGKHQFAVKTLSGARQRPDTYGSFFKNSVPVIAPMGRAFQIDRARLDRCCEHIARALLFRVHGVKWLGPLDIHTPSLFTDVKAGVPGRHELTDKLVALLQAFLCAEPVEGLNQEVFRYRMRHDANVPGFALAAQFYQAFEFYALPTPAESEEETPAPPIS